MKISKKIILILSGVLLVGCNNGTTSSQSNSTNDSSVSTSSSENFEKMKETLDALGTNYIAYDYYYYYFSSSATYDVNSVIVEDRGMLNYANRTGVALVEKDGDTVGYRYGLDMNVSDGEYPFAPAYVESTGFKYGPLTQGTTAYTKEGYSMLYEIHSSSYIEELSDNIYGASSPTFDYMFTETESDDGYPQFTTQNFAVALAFIDQFSFTVDSYGYDRFSYVWYDLIYDSSSSLKGTNFETKITLVEDSSYEGVYSLDVQVFAKDYGTDGDGSLYSQGYPFIERVLTPMSTMPASLKEEVDLSSIIPADFYTTGPGEESEEIAAKRTELKNQVSAIYTDNNYTLDHTYTYTGTSGGYETMYYTATVYNDHVYTFSGKTSADAEANSFLYAYYNLDLNEDYSNGDVAGLRVYYVSAGEVVDYAISGLTADYFKEYLTSYGYTVSDDYIATATDTSGNPVTIDINERLILIFQMNFLQSGYIFDEVQDGKDYFNYLYGCNWEDMCYYCSSTDSFIMGDYFLMSGLFGADTLVSNYISQTTFDVYLGGENSGLNADCTVFSYSSDGTMGFFNLGYLEFSNIGTTILDNDFATYVNTKYGTNYKIADSSPTDGTTSE